MSRTPIRVGLLGAGGIATAHAQALTTLPGVKLVAVADVERERGRRLAERWGGACFDSLEAMLAGATPDAVHILLPPELHARFALSAMAGGAHVLVEKPICCTLDECEELEAAATQLGRTVAVNHNVTFDPTFLRLIDLVRSRRLGAVQHVDVTWNVPWGAHSYAAPLHRLFGPGAVILETAPHPLSLIVRLLGEVRAASVLMTSVALQQPDTWQMSLVCERGTAQCFLGIERPLHETRVHVVGEDGAATADLRLGYLAVSESTTWSPLFARAVDTLAVARNVAGDGIRGFVDRLRRIPGGGATEEGRVMMAGSLGDFYRALASGTVPTASLREGLAVARSCLRVNAAAGVDIINDEQEVAAWAATASS